LEVRELKITHPKTGKVDLSRLRYFSKDTANALRCVKAQEHKIHDILDRMLLDRAKPALEQGLPVQIDTKIGNVHRTVGAMLSGEIAKRYGSEGLPDDTIQVNFDGSAGQSFGAFLMKGVSFRLEGDANDYLGKGLSGGRIAIVPPQGSTFAPEQNIIAGNTLLYGATSGEVYINGCVGERFCVRNSGAIAVVEGVGDHCCEYMTGGRTVVLGATGKNFAAGMSGGIAYVYDAEKTFDYFCNMEMVELTLIEDKADEQELHRLISAHHRYTGSPLAARILSGWEQSLPHFIKVMPIEYKKVLHDEKMKALNDKIAKLELE
jgi:glutamate synthase (NADPH/NADH) large chain